MIGYPVRVRRKSYRGAKADVRRKTDELNRIAAVMEAWINRQIEQRPKEIMVFNYGHISSELSIPIETVRRILFSLDAGHNGFTVALSEATQKELLDRTVQGATA